MGQAIKASNVSKVLALVVGLAVWLGGYVLMDPPLPSAGLASFFGPEMAASGHAFLSLALVGLAAFLLLKRRVIQFPAPTHTLTLFVFVGCIVLSVVFSGYPLVSLGAMGEWAAYSLVAFLVVAVGGRGAGLRVILAGLLAGSTLVALRGLQEYVQNTDASWRVFAGYVNPNIAAAACLVGIGSALTLYGDRRRLPWLLAGVLCMCCLFLTQSKGGLLAAAAMGALFALGGLLNRQFLAPVAVASVLALGFLGGSALQKAQAAKLNSGPAASRILNANGTQEQSSGFRQNLWRGSAKLITENPVGRGIGTYAYHSAKPGITPQTQYAHNSFLQLGVEIGIPGLLALLAVLGFWTRDLWRGRAVLNDPNRNLRYGIFAAVGGLAAHSLVDSDLHHYGIGIAFFTMIGVGYTASTDAVTPEFVAKLGRGLAAGLSALAALGAIFTLQTEPALANFYAKVQGRTVSANETVPGLTDHRALYLEAIVASDREERIKKLGESIASGPTPRAHRALAREYAADGQSASAISALDGALALDPNNLSALALKMDTQRTNGDLAGALETARRIVAVEDTPYFKIRALPELIPLETYDARRLLVNSTKVPTEQVNLLKPALAGYAAFALRTVPQIKSAEAGGSFVPGFDLDDAKRGVSSGRETLAKLRQLGEKGTYLDDAEATFDATGF